MDDKVFGAIINELKPLIEEQGFKANDDGVTFDNEKISFRLGYDSDKKLLLLDVADFAEDGILGEYNNASAWLFDEGHGVKDAGAAGIDFADTLKKRLGVKQIRRGSAQDIALPKSEAGGAPNMDMLCQKSLAIFPEFKETYKNHVATYGDFLYIEFFKTTVAPKLGTIIDASNKKQMKKIVDMLAQMYVDGDRNVQNVIVGIILGGAVGTDKSRYDTIAAYMDDCTFLRTALSNFLPHLARNKKIKEIFRKD